jgi:NADPH-dependent curcumin reductase CurA
MMSDRVNRQWRLAARPEGLVEESDFEWVEEPVGEVEDGKVLVRNIYLSLDPANRGWVRKGPSYVEPVEIGEVMRGLTLGVVEASRNDRFAEGDIVSGAIGWQDYGISDGSDLRKIPPGPLPLTAHLGLFGMVGLTAYFGLLEVGRPEAGETLVVSGAAGAVGSIAGQIGKIVGCRVVGIAGTDAKCAWLTDELGLDAAINYKTESVARRLHKLCPDGIDVIFENVGGDILDAELMWINNYARVVLCGLISYARALRLPLGPGSAGAGRRFHRRGLHGPRRRGHREDERVVCRGTAEIPGRRLRRSRDRPPQHQPAVRRLARGQADHQGVRGALRVLVEGRALRRIALRGPIRSLLPATSHLPAPSFE